MLAGVVRRVVQQISGGALVPGCKIQAGMIARCCCVLERVAPWKLR